MTLTRQAFVEFDLEAMFDAEAYADFALLWLVCHQSRVEGERPDTCWLELWTKVAATDGTRALDQLRFGVEEALEILGTGFLKQPANDELRRVLETGALSREDYLRALMRLVYRLLFLFVAEDRDVLLDPDADRLARERYVEHYSTARLRRLAGRRRGGRHHDLYEQLKLVMHALHEDGCAPIALPPLGSLLWSPEAIGGLGSARLANEDLLDTIRQLAFVEQDALLRPVDFRNLGSEELGSVYESLLDLQPAIDLQGRHFTVEIAPGSERQGTGAYYTPESLIGLLLDATLDPVLDRAQAADDPQAALLDLRVCDPACGSGHFLIAAAHRIARRLAAARTGDPEPGPDEQRAALREVIGSCVYGVDVNPTAAELCKVSLWLEAMVPGRPLSFLDAHIRVGDSLLGTTIALVEEGVPDGAFKPLLGDDKDLVAAIRKQNAQERKGQLVLGEELEGLADELAAEAATVEHAAADGSLADVRAYEDRVRELEDSELRERLRAAADGWVAAFVGPRGPAHPRWTTAAVRSLATTADRAACEQALEAAALFRPFHWQLEFPAVFAEGGFDAVVGNPPWGRVKLQEKRFFAADAPDIAAAPNKAARERMIKRLEDEDPELLARYHRELRRFEALSLLFHHSDRYPLTGVGDVNTYALFAELGRMLLRPQGRAGMVLQLGIVTDDTTKRFFADLVDSRSLVAVYGFENEEKLFPAVHNQTKFCVLSTASPGGGPEGFELSFFNRQPSTARDEDRCFTLSANDVSAINPNTRTCPVFRSSRDAEIVRLLHRRFPILIADGPPERNPWGVTFQRMFDMANDSHLFRTAEQLTAEGWTRSGPFFERGDERWVPLLEGKMTWLWNPRSGTYEGQTQAQANKQVLPPTRVERLSDPAYFIEPRYWVPEQTVASEWKGHAAWALAWRDIGPSERTFVVCAVPRYGSGNKLPLMHPPAGSEAITPCLLAALSSLVTDYSVRVRTATGAMVFFLVKQLPVPEPSEFDEPAPWSPDTTLREWVTARALELIYTFHALEHLARDVGFDGPPFGWDPERRRHLQAELDAAFFHVAGLSREHAEHILDSFRVLRENEEKAHGEFLTRRLVLEQYDALETASRAADLAAAG